MTRFTTAIVAAAIVVSGTDARHANDYDNGQFSASIANEHVWMPRANLNTTRSDIMGVAVNGLVYAIGGCEKNEFLPSPYFPGNEHTCATISRKVEVFNPKMNEFKPYTDLPAARFRGTAAVHGNHIYVFAGIADIPKVQDYSGDFLNEKNETVYPNVGYPTTHNTVLMLDTAAETPQWTTVGGATPLESRLGGWTDMTSFVYNTKIYVLGGFDAGGDVKKTEIFNPVSESWETGPELKTARGDTSAVVMGSKAYVFGGFTTTGGVPNPLDTMEVLDFNSFEAGWLVHHERAAVGRGDVGMAVLHDKIVVFGGERRFSFDEESIPQRHVEIFKENIGWVSGGELHTARFRLSAVAIDNTVFLMGGQGFLNPENNEFETSAKTDEYLEAPGLFDHPEIELHGSGTTNPSKFFWKLMDTFEDQSKVPLRMTYRGIGSSSGQTEFIGDETTDFQPFNDFGSGDIPLSEAQHTLIESYGDKVMHIPIAVGAVAVFHNAVLSRDTPLKLSPCVLARIFTGDITRWNQADIVAQNAHMSNADFAIRVIHRSSGSSSTAGLTNYLHLACPETWTAGPQSKSDEFPDNSLQVSGSDGMVSGLERTAYSIGYLDSGTGEANGLFEVMLKNKNGEYYTAAQSDISSAVAVSSLPDELTADFSGVSAYYRAGDKVWPIVAITYVYVRVDQTGKGPTAALLRAFLDYCLSSEGQTTLADEFGFEALPEAVLDSVKAGLDLMEMPYITPTFTIETKDTVDVKTGAGEFVISAKRSSFDDYDRGVLRKQVVALQAQLNALSGAGGFTASEVTQLVIDEVKKEKDDSSVYEGLSIAALVVSLLALLVACMGKSGNKKSGNEKSTYLADADPVRVNDSRDGSINGSVARV